MKLFPNKIITFDKILQIIKSGSNVIKTCNSNKDNYIHQKDMQYQVINNIHKSNIL